MRIDLDEVRRIAMLAHLDFPESELPRLAEQLSAILTYMESLARVDTSGVEPMFHSLEQASPFRPDEPRPSLGSEEATRGAPGARDGQFLVPRIIG